MARRVNRKISSSLRRLADSVFCKDNRETFKPLAGNMNRMSQAI
jgi:hypothetical protein